MAQAIAETMRVDPASVKVTMRFLREAGLLTQGAHGVNAPDMTSLDLAHTIIAHIAYEKPGSRGVEAVKVIGGMSCWALDEIQSDFSLEALRKLETPFTFTQALTALIEVYAFDWDTVAYRSAERSGRDGTIEPPECKVEVCFERYGPGAFISMGPKDDLRTGVYKFERQQLSIRELIAQEREIPPINSLRWITEENLKPLAEEFAGLA